MNLNSLKAGAIQFLIGILLVVMLPGCINSTSSQSTTVTNTKSSQVTPIDTQGSTQIASNITLNQNASFNLSSLNIQATAFACPMDEWLYDYVTEYSGGNVVLTDSNASLDAGAIANLTDSINQGDPSLLPNGFAAVLGGFISSDGSGGCHSIWEITNTSQNIIQITQIALRYTADPQSNTNHYNLIDLCSLSIQSKAKICTGGRGAGGGVQTFDFKLGTGSNGTIVSSQETQTLSIDAGATVKIDLVVAPADTSNPDYVYSIVPQLTLNTSSQPQEVSQMTNTIVFTDSSQVSCYQLQSDNTFIQMNNPPIPFGQDNNGNFIECV